MEVFLYIAVVVLYFVERHKPDPESSIAPGIVLPLSLAHSNAQLYAA